eukprot:9220375-Pyramimonas_sp.AAC.1
MMLRTFDGPNQDVTGDGQCLLDNGSRLLSVVLRPPSDLGREWDLLMRTRPSFIFSKCVPPG